MDNPNNSRQIEILMVEDSTSDADLTIHAMEESKLLLNLNVVTDGVEALAYLRREGRYASAPRPDLILLDLNLPKKDGRAVLAEVKTDNDLKNIPVVVLTTSQADEDIARAYALHANAYIAKPVDLNQFIRVVNIIEDFWLTVVKLPRGCS